MNHWTPATLTILSKRQQEILQAACDGPAHKVIPAELGVSPRTLEGHWRAIYHKFCNANRCQAGFQFAAMREIRTKEARTSRWFAKI